MALLINTKVLVSEGNINVLLFSASKSLPESCSECPGGRCNPACCEWFGWSIGQKRRAMDDEAGEADEAGPWRRMNTEDLISFVLWSGICH